MTGADPGLGLDLEIDPGNQRLLALGAVRGERSLHRQIDPKTPQPAALRELDAFASGAPFVYGHNIWWHDLPWLQQQGGASMTLGLPAIDTLALSAIAFAEHPYHALFKAYKPVRGSRNDPVGDAEAAGQLLQDAAARLRQLADADPRFGRLQHSLGWLPRLASVRRVTVAAVVLRQRGDGDDAHAGGLRTDSWHVVLPEIEWQERGEPDSSAIAP